MDAQAEAQEQRWVLNHCASVVLQPDFQFSIEAPIRSLGLRRTRV